MKRKKSHIRESLPQILVQMFAWDKLAEICQPVLHLNCRGCIEAENCGAVLEYSEYAITLQLCEKAVTIRGENLIIRSLNAHILEIDGCIKSIELV